MSEGNGERKEDESDSEINQIKSKVLEMCGGGRMEINNLETIMKPGVPNNNEYCSYCDTPCYYRGQPNHLPLPPEVPELITSADSFCNGGTNWKFFGSGCFNFQNKFIHLDVLLLPSRFGGHCTLILTVKSCSKESKVELNEIRESLVSLYFMDNKMDIVSTKHVRVAGLKENSINQFLSMDEQFCTTKALDKFCQQNPEGSNRKSSRGETSKEHEFVSFYVKLRIVLEQEHDVHKFLTCSSCDSIEQLEVRIRTPNAALNKIDDKISGEVNTIADSMAKSQFGEQNAVTAVTKYKAKHSSKFSDHVNIKYGPSLEYSLSIHKNILIDNSPVFRTMLETTMLESKTGEIKLCTVSPEVMEAFICFLYGTQEIQWITKDVDLMVGVLELAHQYQMNPLVNSCIRTVVSKKNEDLTMKSVLRVYACGHKLNISDLQCRVLQWFLENKDTISPQEEQNALSEFLLTENAAAVSLIVRLKAGFNLNSSLI